MSNNITHIVLAMRSVCFALIVTCVLLNYFKNGTLLLYHVPFFLICSCIRSKKNLCSFDHMPISCSFQGRDTLAGTLKTFVQ